MQQVKWNAKIEFPTTSDTQNRIIGATFGPSNGGSPMLTIESEVVAPQEVEVGDNLVTIAGVKTKQYYVTQSFKKDEHGNRTTEIDEAKTEKCREAVRNLYRLLGLDPTTINWDNIDTKPLLGIVFLSFMSPDVEPMRKNPTSAQIAEAKKLKKQPEGDILRHPVTKQPLVQYWPKVREIFGVANGGASGNVSVPY